MKSAIRKIFKIFSDYKIYAFFLMLLCCLGLGFGQTREIFYWVGVDSDITNAYNWEDSSHNPIPDVSILVGNDLFIQELETGFYPELTFDFSIEDTGIFILANAQLTLNNCELHCNELSCNGEIIVYGSSVLVTEFGFTSTTATVSFYSISATNTPPAFASDNFSPNELYGSVSSPIGTVNVTNCPNFSLPTNLYTSNLEIDGSSNLDTTNGQVIKGNAIELRGVTSVLDALYYGTATNPIDTLRILNGSNITLGDKLYVNNLVIDATSKITATGTNVINVFNSWDSTGTVELESGTNISIADTATVSENGTFVYTNTGEYTIAGITYHNLLLNGGTFNYNLDSLTVSGTFTNNADTKVTVPPSNIEITNTQRSNIAGSPSLTINFLNPSTSYDTPAQFYPTGTTTYKDITIESGILILTGNTNTTKVDIKENGSLEINNGVTLFVKANFTNHGSFNANKSTVRFNPNRNTTVYINGDNTFYNFYSSCEGTNGNYSLVFEAGKTQTVINNINITSGNYRYKVTIKSSVDENTWILDALESMVTVNNANVKDSYSINPIYSKVSSNSTDQGNNHNWFQPIYRWVGGDRLGKNDWNIKSNWRKGANGNASVSNAPDTSRTDLQLIIANTDPNNYLVLPDNIQAASITVNSGATLDLAGFNVDFSGYSGTGSPFINNGTVKLTGTNNITFPPGKSLTSGDGSTVEYTGGTFNATGLPLGENYKTVKFTNSSGIAFSSITNPLTLSATNATFTGPVTANDLTLNATTATFSGNVTANDLTLNATTATFSGNLNATSISGSINTLTVDGTVTANSFDFTDFSSITIKGGATIINAVNLSPTSTKNRTLTLGTVPTTPPSTTPTFIFGNGLTIGSNVTNTYLAGTVQTYSSGAEIIINSAVKLLNDTTLQTTNGANITVLGAISSENASNKKNLSLYSIDIDTDNPIIFDLASSVDVDKLEITGGTCNVGAGALNIANLVVNADASFVQTGDNGTNTQSVGSIDATGNVTFDSTSKGGTLTLTGNITVNNTSIVNFNKKNVTIGGNLNLSGIFYDLTIPNGVTVTNSGFLAVRRNFTVNETGMYKPSADFPTTSNNLTLGGYGSFSSDNGGLIKINNSSVNLGTVNINLGNTSKTFGTAINAGNITISTGNTGNRNLQFNANLTATSISGSINTLTVDGTVTANSFDFTDFSSIILKDGATIINAVNLSPTSSATLTLGTATTTPTFTFANGLTIGPNVTNTNLAGTLTTGDGKSITLKTQAKLLNDTTFDCNLEVNITTPANKKITGDKNLEFKKNVTLHTDWDINTTGEITANAGSSSQTFAGTDKNISFAGNLHILGGCVFDLGSGILTVGTASTNKNLHIMGQSSFTLGTLNVYGDLYISAISGGLPKAVSFNADSINVTENFALFNGNVSLVSNLSVGANLVLLNGNTIGEGNDNIYRDPDSGIDGLFKYDVPGRPNSDTLISFPLYAQTSTEYKSTLTGFGGKTITVGKNVYNNGVDLEANSKWNLENATAEDGFSEFYNANIQNCNASNDVAAAENCTNVDNSNVNVFFNRTHILENQTVASDNASESGTYTVLDDVIRIEFENGIYYRGNTSDFKKYFKYNIPDNPLDSNIKTFSGAFTNIDCTTSVNGSGALKSFYLKAEKNSDDTYCTWNTDATGGSSGTEESTDFSGEHKSIKPNIRIEKAIFASYNGLRDIHNNRIYVSNFTQTADRTAPVLVEVNIGQELHKDAPTSQEFYDAHNFIEFRYSEPVDIGAIAESVTNKKADDTWGKIENNNTSSNPGFTVAGFGSFNNGKVSTGSRTSNNMTVKENDGTIHALYRGFSQKAGVLPSDQPCRIRLSIAGYVDDTVNVNGHKYWPGFIYSKETIVPNGKFTPIANTNIKDRSEAKGYNTDYTLKGNIFDEKKGKNTAQEITVNDKIPKQPTDVGFETTLYGTWDIDPPVLAQYNRAGSLVENTYEILSVGIDSAAAGFEIHFFDNSDYNNFKVSTNSMEWRTAKGWYDGSVFDSESGQPLDLRGGIRYTARPGASNNKTAGGIRYCSIFNSTNGFTFKNTSVDSSSPIYNVEQQLKENDFSQKISIESFFGFNNSSASSQTTDIPYIRFNINNSQHLISHNYSFNYNCIESDPNKTDITKQGFITDLAGNLLEGFLNCLTPDKTPPKMSLSVAAVNGDKLFIQFSKPLDITHDTIGVNNAQSDKFRRIMKSLDIVGIDGSSKGLIDLNGFKNEQKKINILFQTDHATGLEIPLTRPVTYEEIKSLYLTIKGYDSGNTTIAGDNDQAQPNPITGEAGIFSMIYDMSGNTVAIGEKHILSDFAVNAIDVLYAYDGRSADNAVQGEGLYTKDEWAVRDFSSTKSNYNTILANQDITIYSTVVKSPEDAGTGDAGYTTDIFKMFADISPTANSQGDTYEDNTGIDSNLWFVDKISAYSSEKNTSSNLIGGSPAGTGSEPSGTIVQNTPIGDKGEIRTYVIPNNPASADSANYPAGSTIQFLFKVYDKDGSPIMLDVNGNGNTNDQSDHPLYAIRLEKPDELSSIALWSLNLKDVAAQAGGVTIMNNVINSGTGEETVLEVTVPKASSLTIQVLTADGDIVKTLHRGRLSEGKYYYKWDATNNSGKEVARGMYFIRVYGTNFDETRKVMVVR